MPNINLSILNQKATPAFFADTLANRPAPSFVGRIFISTDTYDLYRDTGSAWVLLSPSSTGTITGGGSLYRVGIWTSTSNLGESNDLVFDYSQGHLGINTNTPGTALDVHHDQPTIAILNQTIATNDARLGFQNNGIGLWRIGAFYNAGANDFAVYDAVNSLERFSVKNTGQTFVGTQTSTSGRFVVNNATSDNHIVIIGANAPSLRINNGGTGSTQRIGIGLATAVNNFIQGTTGGEMAIFNSSTTASPILFGVYDAGLSNTQEAARISSARNLLVGTSVDSGQKLQVSGTALITGAATFSSSVGINGAAIGLNGLNIPNQNYLAWYLSGSSGSQNVAIRGNGNNLELSSGGGLTMTMDANQRVGIGTTSPIESLDVYRATSTASYIVGRNGSGVQTAIGVAADNGSLLGTLSNNNLRIVTNGAVVSTFTTSANLLIGTTTDNGGKLQVNGDIRSQGAGAVLYFQNQDSTNFYAIYGVNAGINIFNQSVGVLGRFDASTGVYTPLSDKNKKKNYEQSNLGLDAVLKLKPTLYNMIDQKDSEAKELGFIAQDVKEVIEQAYVENGEFIGLNYQAIVATLVKAIQELNTKIENIK